MGATRSASIFRNGRNQAIRLPKGMEFDADEVLIEAIDGGLIIRPKPRTWAAYLRNAPTLDPSFPLDIEDQPPEETDSFDLRQE